MDLSIPRNIWKLFWPVRLMVLVKRTACIGGDVHEGGNNGVGDLVGGCSKCW